MTVGVEAGLYERKVAAVVTQVKEAKRLGIPYRKAKVAPSHFVPNSHKARGKEPRIDLTKFNDIHAIDVAGMTCTAEPGVTYSNLVKATLPHGLIPFVVPEHKGITIGGAVSGCSLESMSYKVGGCHDTCIEYDIVTGAGDILTLSRTENPDDFEMVHGSYGTLAILTKLTFRLTPAKPFVHVVNHFFDNFAYYWGFLQERCEKDDCDFVDGIVHGPKQLVACIGHMVDEAPYSTNYERENIYYKSTIARDDDYLTTYDYFFRYDTDAHWLTRTMPGLENRLVRKLFGSLFLGSTKIIKWADRLKPFFALKKRPAIVLAVFIPATNFENFFEWYAQTFDFWPLWIVPYKAPQFYPWLADEHHQKMQGLFLIDCAIYGRPNGDPEVDLDKLIEEKVFELGGIKTLISRNFYEAETFWSVYSKPRSDAAKARLDPDNLFGDLYGKMGRK